MVAFYVTGYQSCGGAHASELSPRAENTHRAFLARIPGHQIR